MSTDRLADLISTAIAEGILPAAAARPVEEHRPWPVILLTALGAWLAAIPLAGSIFLAFNDSMTGPTLYVVGGGVLAGSVAILRTATLSLFVEQLAVPGLLVGGGMLGAGLFRDLPSNLAAALLALLACAIGISVARNWLRVPLGAAACALAILACTPQDYYFLAASLWLPLHAVLGLWLVAQWLDRHWNDRVTPALATKVQWLSAGWLVTILVGLAYFTGMTFLAAASLGGGDYARAVLARPWAETAQLTSLVLAACAAAWIARCWPSLRQLWSTLTAVVLVGLSALTPTLGAVLLVLAICAVERRWRLATTAGVAAAWIIGAFYYQLGYPLATKAVMMVGAGALLGAFARIALRTAAPVASSHPSTPANTRGGRLGIAISTLAVLAVANVGIWQKERLIAQGRPVFVELAPVDPRSLMQGDYMQLNFRLPQSDQPIRTDLPGRTRAQVVAKVDARGIATLVRYHAGAPLAPDEIVIELTPRGGSWTLATDAWYFKEGEGERWAGARYGEFRVDTNGSALLVGMRGASLSAL